tara:strand:- start:1334 stop:2032 length:699 start_codon:yes stop_codon:yes gene_type:complete
MIIETFNELVASKFNLLTQFFKNSRNREPSIINTVVLHWTGGANLTSDIRTLKSRGLGYHFIIDKTGAVFQCAPLNSVVSHAGASYGPNGRYMNGQSVGISFAMTGIKGPSEFTPEMYETCINLIKNIKRSLPNLKYVTGHHWISPGRKVDPYTFDFDKLMSALGNSYQLWKTGFLPFPANLSDCRCIKHDIDGNCLKSEGYCGGPDNEGYSERNLSNEVSDLSFPSDLLNT